MCWISCSLWQTGENSWAGCGNFTVSGWDLANTNTEHNKHKYDGDEQAAWESGLAGERKPQFSPN